MGKIIQSRRKWRQSYIQPGKAWVRAGKGRASGSGWSRYAGLWVGAAAAGLLGGYGLSKWEQPGAIASLDYHEAAVRESIGGGARISFGLCHIGGGTNCVVDGDTFWIGGEKVRIAGIDAPETHPARCAEEARLGNAATGRLRDLLNSGAVTMTSIDRNRDRYGRLLRNVQVDGRDVGDALIGEGLAREYAGGRRPWC